MKILIAEHNPTGRNQLTQMLKLDDHDVLQAVTWEDTLAQFAEHRPDLVLLEPTQPGASGHCCVPELKRLDPNRFVPVILVTSVADPISLSGFLESEADDFIEPPYNHYVLKAKVSGFERVDELYRRLEKFRTNTKQEIKLAKHMFDAITTRKSEEASHIQQWTLAAGHFSGDLLIFERTPDDTLHIMLGDFTGHGLVAAVGALPTSDIFYAMTKKNCGISDIAAEMNRKLHRLLPTGRFCCAALLSISPLTGRLEVWNGGLPPILMIDGQHRVAHRLPSNRLPLGILSAENFDSSTIKLSTEGLYQAILYSDGLIEAQNTAGQEFGDTRLTDALGITGAGGSLLQQIKAAVIGFLGGLEPHDDVSLLTINLETL